MPDQSVPGKRFRNPFLITLGSADLVDRQDPASSATNDADAPETGRFTSTKPLALLTFLAVSPGRSTTRDVAVDLLWADAERDRALHAVRQVLWQLRQLLGDQIVGDRDEIRLVTPIGSDHAGFLTAVEQGDVALAVQLYTGPFLPRFAMPGGAQFEHWADSERERLRTLFVRVAGLQVGRLIRAGKAKEASALARRVRSEAPADDQGWRLLLESLVASRDFLGAGIEAEAAESWFRTEQVAMDSGMREAIRVARQLAPSDSHETADLLRPDLIGRHEQFATLIGAWEEVRSNRTIAVQAHLVGNPGIGKTRLLSDLATRLRATGASVLMLSPHPADRGMPYAFASALAAQILRLPGARGISAGCVASLRALNPAIDLPPNGETDSSIGAEALRRRTIALTEAINAAAEEKAVGLLIDDLQWIDPTSADLLRSLLPRLHHTCVITARRSGYDHASVSTVGAVIELTGLTPSQVREFVESIAALQPAEWSDQLVAGLSDSSKGSPLVLLELLRLASDRGLLTVVESNWHSADPDALVELVHVRQGITLRAAALGDVERFVLALLGVAGMPVTLSTIAAAAERDPAQIADTLALLEGQGFVVARPDGIVLSHDTIADTMGTILTPERMTEVSADMGRALVRNEAGPPTERQRGCQLLALSGRENAALPLVTDHLRGSLARGHRISTRELVAEYLGPDVPSAVVDSIVHQLPWPQRLGLTSRTLGGAAAAAIVLVAVILIAAFRPTKEPLPTGGFAIFTQDMDMSAPPAKGTLMPRRTILETIVPIETTLQPSDRGFKATTWTQFSDTLERDLSAVSSYSPDGKSILWITQPHGPGGTSLDITEHGHRRHLVSDSARSTAGWTPDGRVVFSSARWEGPGEYNLALLDPRTANVRRLTVGKGRDEEPSASPDGTRIAFVRYYGALRKDLCWVTLSGSREHCRSLEPADIGALIGWTDAHTVLIRTGRMQSQTIATVDIDAGDPATVLEIGFFQGAWSSPDGQWLLTGCGKELGESRLCLIERAHPTTRRPVDFEGNRFAHWASWKATGPTRGGVSSMKIGKVPRALQAGSLTMLSATAFDVRSRPMTIPAQVVEWSTSDVNVARVDSTSGALRPLHDGSVTVKVRAGDAVDSIRITVSGRMAEWLVERWESVRDSVWDTRGWKPNIRVSTDGVDSSHRSLFITPGDTAQRGVVLRRGFDGTSGVGTEAQLEFDTGGVFEVGLHFIPVWTTPGVEPPREDAEKNAREGEQCSYTVIGNLASTGTYPNSSSRQGSTPPIRVVGVHRIRVQIFPGGDCGVAIDGQPVWRSPHILREGVPYRVVVGGNAPRSGRVVGPIEVWAGVRPDVAW